MPPVTEILAAAKAGDPDAPGRLFERVYAELRSLAAHRMRLEHSNHTLQATALVHEAWLRLGGESQPPWSSRAQFFTAASEAMRRILVEAARRKRTLRRGGDKEFVELDGAAGCTDGGVGVMMGEHADAERLLQVNEALERFAQIDPFKAELVKLRHFVGLSIPETAAVLGISETTAKRHWAYARAWLLREL